LNVKPDIASGNVNEVGVAVNGGSGARRLSEPGVNGGSASVWLRPGPLPFAVWKGINPSS
jgi:hypothetical protein